MKAQTAETIPLLKRAIELDPQFAMAYAYLGRQYGSFGESELGAQNIAKAYELRNGVSDEENYFIAFNYHRQVARNLELARQTLESWAQTSPRDLEPHGFLAAFTSQGSGHYDKAAEEGLKAIGLDPDYSIGYDNVAFAYIYQNRLAEAEALLRKASERKIESIELSLCRYFISFLRNDQTAMQREMTQRQAKLEAQGFFEHQEALTMAYHGRLKEAARLSDRAVSLSRQAGLRERASLFEGARAAWSALLGIREAGQRGAAAALSLYRSRDADYGPAFALALLDESAQAHKIEAEPGKALPGGHICPVQLPACAAGTGSPQSGCRSEGARNDRSSNSVRPRGSGYSLLHRLLLRSSLSGLRAWPRLFPVGPPSRGSGRVSENSGSSGNHAERSDGTTGPSPTGPRVVRFRGSREIGSHLPGPPCSLERCRSRYSVGSGSESRVRQAVTLHSRFPYPV